MKRAVRGLILKGRACGVAAGRGTLTSRISKFGVGAIHAGFYIGTRVKVLTRTSVSADTSTCATHEGRGQKAWWRVEGRISNRPWWSGSAQFVA
jgi:hypothetical protein